MLTRMVAAVDQLSADTEPRACVFAEEPSMPALSTCQPMFSVFESLRSPPTTWRQNL